jgi:Protein of unknown function (DUF2806)
MSNGQLPILPEGFGRAAEKLADTIRHVVDIVVGPDRIRAKAQGQADSALILAEGRAQVQEIEACAIERLRKREARRQTNIESITLKALDALPPPTGISEQPVSEDWTSRFFEECQDISDEQMQQIWARIMAGEVLGPDAFLLERSASCATSPKMTRTYSQNCASSSGSSLAQDLYQ